MEPRCKIDAPYALNLLRKQQEHQRLMPEVVAAGKLPGHTGERKRLWEDSGRIWTNGTGGLMAPSNLRRSMESTYTAAQVRPLRVYRTVFGDEWARWAVDLPHLTLPVGSAITHAPG